MALKPYNRNPESIDAILLVKSIQAKIASFELIKTDESNPVIQQHMQQIVQGVQSGHDFQESQIELLHRRSHEHERRILDLEYKLNISTPDKIINSIRKIFSKIPIIESVYSRSTQSGFILVTIYNEGNISDALKQIQQGFIKLEDEFPNTYFEPWILHLTEVQNEHLLQSTMIFKR